MVDQREPKSILVFGSFRVRHFGALYEIELEKFEKLEENEGRDEYTLPLLDRLLECFDKKWEIPKFCIFHGAKLGSKVYIILNKINAPHMPPFRPPDAFFFNTNDLESNVQRFSPPKSPKTWGAVISAYGKLYNLQDSPCYPYIHNPSFERYDPTHDSWETLPPYPGYSYEHYRTQITGHAVLYGYILVSLMSKKGCLMAAFHIATKTWHQVKVSESMKEICDGFWGRAIVLDNTIYALSSDLFEVLVFSFGWEPSDEDDFGRSHYQSPIVCLFLDPLTLARVPIPFDSVRTQNLVHLRQRDFCLLQTGRNEYVGDYQFLLVTTFRIVGEGEELSIETLKSRVFRLSLDIERDFDLDFCFTRDCEDIEPEEKEECKLLYASCSAAQPALNESETPA